MIWILFYPYQDVIENVARRYRFPPYLLAGLAKVESNFDPHAFNPISGARGLFQFLPETARKFGINPWDPEESADAACKYLKILIRKYNGDTVKALLAFGGFLRSDGTLVNPRSATFYISRIYHYRNHFKKKERIFETCFTRGTRNTFLVRVSHVNGTLSSSGRMEMLVEGECNARVLMPGGKVIKGNGYTKIVTPLSRWKKGERKSMVILFPVKPPGKIYARCVFYSSGRKIYLPAEHSGPDGLPAMLIKRR